MNIRDCQQKDPELKLIMDYIEKVDLLKDDKKARQLVWEGHYTKLLKEFYPTWNQINPCILFRQMVLGNIFYEVHGGIFGSCTSS